MTDVEQATVPMQSSQREGFTLVELLLVVVILTTLLGFLAPVTVSFTSSSRLVSAGQMVNNLAALARQKATVNNTLTALVLLGQQGTLDDYRAFAVAEYQQGNGWTAITAWETLPEGIVVDASNTAECTFLINSPNPFPFLNGSPVESNPPLLYQGSPVQPTAYAARIFLPSGRLLDSEVSSCLRLVEGFVQEAKVIYTQTGSVGGSPNFYDITILGASGMIKTSRPGQ